MNDFLSDINQKKNLKATFSKFKKMDYKDLKLKL